MFLDIVSNKVKYVIYICVCILNNDIKNDFYKTRSNQNIMHKLKIQEKKNKIQKPKQRSKISKTQRKKT